MAKLSKELQEARNELARREKEALQSQEAVEKLERDLATEKAALAAEKAKPKSPPKPKPEPKPDKKKVSSALGKIDLDEGPDAPPITEQIAKALRANAGKVCRPRRETALALC